PLDSSAESFKLFTPLIFFSIVVGVSSGTAFFKTASTALNAVIDFTLLVLALLAYYKKKYNSSGEPLLLAPEE
ncbi:hypothetical protein, partial [Pseudomonas viridiflava]|uniref:hypothetical protein n=1 Tax=Pseudomonas viridiflava TaxID=33069 RepID=UPI0019D3158E